MENKPLIQDSIVACNIVIDDIIGKISSRQLNPGDKLLPERDLAATLHVSRATVREAMKVLNHMGFISSVQGSGNFVTDDYEQVLSKIMSVVFLRGDISPQDFMIFRRMLEFQSFDLALVNASDSQKSEMLQIVNLIDVCTNPKLVFSLDAQFHSLLAESSKNAFIISNYHAISEVTSQYMHDSYFGPVASRNDGFALLQNTHRAIVDALIAGNREKGRQAIYDHYALTLG